ncbi:hypothetical protein [Mucilaginibacter terrae]|uniref:Uncharacterized membrane protein YraQ (UPF0718 family) n=1 Tax=Mucilaginibacter terrae TaxID=1955052 RepID=A0ABU3GX71_9SPHI|nr:hypothetical protein [Mucilaginibacter terrae]MDT3404371.1 uncharacterized membrane protein YraQ (UPF0718 family) [Mucilaginibacter terrae]
MQTLKVKDYYSTYLIIAIPCTFPIALAIVSSVLNWDVLLAFFITFIIYAVLFTFYVRFLNREQDKYLITADEEKLTLRRYGTFQWNAIVSIEAYTKNFGWGRRRSDSRYVNIKLADGRKLSINVDNCDYSNDEIAERLHKIGGFTNLASVKQN